MNRSEDEKLWCLVQGSVDLLAKFHRSIPEQLSPYRERHAATLEQIGRAANRLGWLAQRVSDPLSRPFGPEPAKRQRTKRRRAGKQSKQKQRSPRPSENDEGRLADYLRFVADFSAVGAEIVGRYDEEAARAQLRSAARAGAIADGANGVIAAIKKVEDPVGDDIVKALTPIAEASRTLGRGLIQQPSLDVPLAPEVRAAAQLMRRGEAMVFDFFETLARESDVAQSVTTLREGIDGAKG